MQRKTGFTLIEILISITLLTIVLGAVYSSFFSVQNVFERFENVSIKYHESRTALDIMRREIESSLLKNPGTGQPEKGNNIRSRTEFVIRDREIQGKNSSELNLTAFSFRGSTLNTVSYSVETKEDKLNLVKKENPMGDRSAEYTTEMIEGIEGFTVETLYNNKWVKTWDTAITGRLPDIVRFSIEFDDNGKKIVLKEYARPKVGKYL